MNDQLPNYRTLVQPGDMVLCRVNAPLVSECFKFLKESRLANIQGRNVGEGLIKTVKAMKAFSVVNLIAKLNEWLSNEKLKENAKKYPDENRLIAIQDRYDCLICFMEGLKATEHPDYVIQKIQSIFTDNKDAPGIRLSSIHRAKGLESKRVFILEPKGATCPHPMAKTAWQLEQEWNLRYVAITRAIEELVFVS